MSRRVATLIYSKRCGGPYRKAVLAYMADRANDDGSGVYCSKGTIADETEIARSTVFKIISELVEEGVIFEAGRRPCRNGFTVNYSMDLTVIAGWDDVVKGNATSPTAGPVRSVTSPPTGPHQSASRTPTSPPAGPKPSFEPSLNQEEPPLVPPKAKSTRRKPEVPIPEDWIPSEQNIADAQARQFSDKEIENEANRFRDHHLSRDTRFRDWDAAWRTWLGNARRFAGRGMAGKPAPGGHGRGGSIAGIVARRWADGQV